MLKGGGTIHSFSISNFIFDGVSKLIRNLIYDSHLMRVALSTAVLQTPRRWYAEGNPIPETTPWTARMAIASLSMI